MFELSVKAGMPFVSVTTDDPVTMVEVMEFLLGVSVPQYNHKDLLKKDTVYWTTSLTEEHVSRAVYLNLLEHDSVVIIVNQELKSHLIFDVGVLPTPQKLKSNYLTQITTADVVELIMPCLTGLTIKNTMNVVRLASAKYGELTPEGVYGVRSLILGATAGLNRVDTALPLYIQNNALDTWISVNKPYFPKAVDARLIPRGLLLVGSAGVGKTQGAKFIANSFGVPLYHLDLSSTLNRYVGSSEANLSNILRNLDNEAPAVLLIDEVEKLFSQQDDSGVTSRLLAQLLWWLQEHTTPIFVVMTTNDIEAIPPELYRAGRIDCVFEIPKITELNDALKLVEAILSSMGLKHLAVGTIHAQDTLVDAIELPMSHAEITQLTINTIKELALV